MVSSDIGKGLFMRYSLSVFMGVPSKRLVYLE